MFSKSYIEKKFSWIVDAVKLLPAKYLERYLLELVRKALDYGNVDYFKAIVSEFPQNCDQEILIIFHNESAFYREPKNTSGYKKCKAWLKIYLESKFEIDFTDNKRNKNQSAHSSKNRTKANTRLPEELDGDEREEVENLIFFFQNTAAQSNFLAK